MKFSLVYIIMLCIMPSLDAMEQATSMTPSIWPINEEAERFFKDLENNINERDPQQIIASLTQMAEQKENLSVAARATLHLACIYGNGQYAGRERDRGLLLMIQVAEQSDDVGAAAGAQCNLGNAYYFGSNGVPINRAQGLTYLRRAAHQSYNKEAQQAALEDLAFIEAQKTAQEQDDCVIL